MTHCLQHSFEIRRTEFTSQKDNCDLDGASLQLLDSTCLLNYGMNRNNIIEGNNIIYISGAYITFLNFFQNSKQFGALVSSYRPIGMVGNNMSKGNVAIVTQKQDKSQLYVCMYTFCQEFVPTHCIKKSLVFIDIVMIRTTYIYLAVMDPITKQNSVYVLNSKSSLVINFDYKIKRLISQQHKIIVIFEEGGMFCLDNQQPSLPEQIIVQHKQKIIQDYCQIQNQLKVILTTGSVLYCYCFQPQKEFEQNVIKQLEEAKVHRMMKVGRNLFLAHRNSLTISHFFIGQQNLVFVSHHVYHQKLKANIISAQSSQDQMHAALAVQIIEKQQIKIQNFLFNLSSISKSHEYISPFTRLMNMGADYGICSPMQNVLSSNSYLLSGSKIVNLFHSTGIQRKKMLNLYEVPKFMTVHPLGHQFLCGFDNIIKFYNKIQKDMQQTWSEQYICTAAKYSKNGSLLLSCIQETFTTLIIYDCYNFKKIRNVPIPLLKIYATKIQWVQNNSAVVLYSNNQLVKVNIFNGQKLSEYKDKKDSSITKCIDYDSIYDLAILGTNTNSMMIASKNQQGSHNLTSLRNINFPQQISCIKINQLIRVIFFGSKSGALYWCNYPFKLKTESNQQGVYNTIQQLSKIKLHNFPIISIDLTSNSKFMLVNIRGQGYFTFRVRKMKNKDMNGTNMNAIFQQLGNPIFNTIDTSSLTNYTANKQKLKIALEKRKQCFNDLQQFRREWQVKSTLASRQIEISTKRNQLNFINETLQNIETIKQQKKKVEENILNITKVIEDKKNKKQQVYTTQMLQLYQQTEKQKKLLENKKKEFDSQYEKLIKQCSINLAQIQQDLTVKRNKFENNYRMMLKNIDNFKKRFQYQKLENIQQKKLQIEDYLKNLQLTEIQLNTLSNQLSIKITQSKKQYERYCNRKSFLEFKNRFFLQQNQKCKLQKERLIDLKQKYQAQLKQLEVYTQKKEKKLRVYLTQNQALRKYKQIHTNLTQNAVRQTDFIKQQQNKLDQNIVQVQKQLSGVASANEIFQKQIKEFQNGIDRRKDQNYNLNLKMKDIGFYLNSILSAMQAIGYCQDENQKTEKLKQIYNTYYVQKKIQCILEKQTRSQPNYQKNLLQQKNQKLKNQQTKILNQLKNQKQYIIQNIQVFKNYNKRINQQINLNYLQIQSQNYNLIAQCNLRKQQAIVKKKALNQLIDSVKQTQIYLQDMKKQNKFGNTRIYRRSTKSAQQITEVPFVTYEKLKFQKAEQFKLKLSQEGFTNKSIITPSLFRPLSHKAIGNHLNIKKMLDIKGLADKKQQQMTENRRIQTANINNKKLSTTQVAQDRASFGIIKPLTATLKKRCQRQNLKSAITIKNKESSKPSTCATYSRAIFY